MTRYEWRLKEVAQRAGLNHIALAKRLNRNQDYMLKLFKLKRVPVLSGLELEKLLIVLDCSLEELIIKVEDELAIEDETAT